MLVEPPLDSRNGRVLVGDSPGLVDMVECGSLKMVLFKGRSLFNVGCLRAQVSWLQAICMPMGQCTMVFQQRSQHSQGFGTEYGNELLSCVYKCSRKAPVIDNMHRFSELLLLIFFSLSCIN